MTSRERVIATLNHQEPDRVPLDLGASATTGMHVSTVYVLRQALDLDPPGTPVKVVEPYQMLGEIAPDLVDALGVDVLPLDSGGTMFGFPRTGWKPWTLFDGTPVLVPDGFNIEPDTNGDILMYPAGDRSVPPSGRMPNGGFYFDAIPRQRPIDDHALNVDDNLEEFGPVSDGELDHFRREAQRLHNHTDKAILASFAGTGFGDIALVPGLMLKHPKGIRDVAEWYISTVSRPHYVMEVFERQCQIALDNLARLHHAVGERIHILFMSGTDFGQQNGPFISPNTYRELYKPFNRRLNDWVHEHTAWKTFIHTCGSVTQFIEDFIDAGFDIMNPVQTSAADMDPARLKARFGDRLVFWGGGVDTQHTLPFGTPDQVRRQVAERIRIFGSGGGFVFNTIHNVQAQVPVENVLAMVDTLRDQGAYPLR